MPLCKHSVCRHNLLPCLSDISGGLLVAVRLAQGQRYSKTWSFVTVAMKRGGGLCAPLKIPARCPRGWTLCLRRTQKKTHLFFFSFFFLAQTSPTPLFFDGRACEKSCRLCSGKFSPSCWVKLKKKKGSSTRRRREKADALATWVTMRGYHTRQGDSTRSWHFDWISGADSRQSGALFFFLQSCANCRSYYLTAIWIKSDLTRFKMFKVCQLMSDCRTP